MDAVEDTIYKLAALGGAVILCQVNIFINGYFGGDGLKIQEFTNTHAHQDHIQYGNPFGIPVLKFGFDEFGTVFFLLNCGGEQ